MKSKKLISALSPLKPVQIIDVSTGEILSLTVHDTIVKNLINYVLSETKRLYRDEGSRLETEIINAKARIGSANSFGRQRGFKSGYHSLPTRVKVKSRINELVLHKLVSETAAYVNNPNPLKQPPSFGPKINLGAADKQLSSLSLTDKVLTLHFKVWDKELLIDFRVPDYILQRNIQKWSLPTIEVRNGEVFYIFSIIENVVLRKNGTERVGIDLGRVEPFTMAIVNSTGKRIAEYNAKHHVKEINLRRERIIKEKKFISKKIKQYDALGLDSFTLKLESQRKANKATRLGQQISLQVGADVASKLEKHRTHQVALENLKWVTGSKYGGRWIHSKKSNAIEHALTRKGISVKKVSAKNTSSTCHSCSAVVISNPRNRTVRCVSCKTKLDRDFNAAVNIAKKLKTYPNQYSRIGDNCSLERQVIEEKTHRSALGNMNYIENTT